MTGTGSDAASAGALLKTAREARGLSPEQAAEQLRLSRSIVLAMEQDRYDELGPAVFARGHLRKYAQLVGADAGAVLEAHSRSQGAAGESASLLPPASANRPVGGEPRWLRPALSLAAVLLAVGAVAGGGWWAWQRFQATGGPDEAAPPVPAPFQEPALPAIEESVQAAVEEPAPETSDEPAAPEPASGAAPEEALPAPTIAPTPAPQAPAAAAGLVLGFSGPCWVEVYDADGRRLAYDLAQAGESRRFGGTGPWRVVLGNATAARVIVNGRVVTIPGRLVTNNTASLLVDAEGNVQRRPLPLS